ncbi:MAG: hypothetical protein KatS3mg022_1246 [Armatimonadota bacterium]|nr:MAG: hypothetical protein KatS3mg022_1246 [Armatimonadota bacterium]
MMEQVWQDFLARPGVYVGAICTIGLMTLIYRENVVYRFFEHIFIGLAAGFSIVVLIKDVLDPFLYQPVFKKGEWYWTFVFMFGLLFYFIHSRKHNWLSRLPIGFLMGFSAGQIFQIFSNTYLPQLSDSFRPLYVVAADGSFEFAKSLNNLIFMIVLVTVMSYFFFSFEQKSKAIRNSAQLGRWVMMVAFGAIFGTTIMARMALLFDRMYFIFSDWLRLVQ